MNQYAAPTTSPSSRHGRSYPTSYGMDTLRVTSDIHLSPGPSVYPTTVPSTFGHGSASWGSARDTTSSQPPGIDCNAGSASSAPLSGVLAPLLLSRSIRTTATNRQDGGLSRGPSGYAISGDETDDGSRGGVCPVESPQLPSSSTTGGSPSFQFAGGQRSGLAHGRCSPAAVPTSSRLSSPASSSLGVSAAEGPLPTSTFEALWDTIDSYLFAVYTTLQTGDESSLRPLRTPRHRMGWYTVIYNACSGDPAKSRELYARLALLLLHLLESHVLFPVLQNIDQRLMRVRTGTEESGRGDGAGQTPSGGHHGSPSAWSRLRSIAPRARRSHETSHNSSFRSATPQMRASGGPGSSNTSFGFMRRLLHSSFHASSSSRTAVNGGDAEARRSSSPVALSARLMPSTEATTGTSLTYACQPGTGTRGSGWSLNSVPNTLLSPQGPPSSNGGGGSGAASRSSAASKELLARAFEGFDSAVDHNHQRTTATVATPNVVLPRSPSPVYLGPTHAAQRTMTHPNSPVSSTTASSTRGLPIAHQRSPPTLPPPSTQATAPPTAVASRHTRMGSTTGRVLVSEEEEVLREEFTVTPERPSAANALPRTAPPPQQSEQQSYSPRSGKHRGAAEEDRDNCRKADSPTVRRNFLPARGWHPRQMSALDDDDLVDDSLRSMRSSLSSHSSDDGPRRRHGGAAGSGAATIATMAAFSVVRPGQCVAQQSWHGNLEEEEGTAVPSATFRSPSFASLSSTAEEGEDKHETANGAELLSMNTITAPVAAQQAAAVSPVPVHDRKLSTTASGFYDTASSPTSPLGTASASPNTVPSRATTTTWAPWYASPPMLSRQESSTGPESILVGQDTAAPTTPVNASVSSAAVPDTRGGGGGGVAQESQNRRFSLCYTFIQEWQTFLAFRGAVLSCFRYLDQYYTRRFGMDTISLMCVKVFYVVVYEPLLPLLLMELNHLTFYLRDVFESTGQVALEQMELIQATYFTMTQLLILVQSTTSSMVAQQQKPSANATGGIGNATVTNTTSSAVLLNTQSGAGTTTDGRQRSRASSGARSMTGAEMDSAAGSVASTPRVHPLDSSTSTTGFGGAVGSPAESSSAQNIRKGRRLFSFFSSGRRSHHENSKTAGGDRHGEEAAAASVSPRASPLTPGAEDEPQLTPPGSLPRQDSSAATAGWTSADQAAATAYGMPPSVEVDLRGTVELRDRLEVHTAAYHQTTQALKQWEGLSAERRLRSGTIVKETAQPLSVIVMSDMGNNYVAGIMSFYKHARDARRATEEGRRGYVAWASEVKKLELQVWRSVRLPFLHAALRSTLNEVLVVAVHRSVLLDVHFGLRALLEQWSEAAKASATVVAQPGPPLSHDVGRGTFAAVGGGSSSPAVWRQLGTGPMRPTPSSSLWSSFSSPAAHTRSDSTVAVGEGRTMHGDVFLASTDRAMPLSSGGDATLSSLPGRREHASSVPSGVTEPHTMESAEPSNITSVTAATAGLYSLYRLFSDVTEEECFVLMAAVLITKLLRDAADVFTRYFQRLDVSKGRNAGTPPAGEGGLLSPSSAAGLAAPQLAAPQAAHMGLELTKSLVELLERYTDLVEEVFEGQPVLQRAIGDAMEEIMCPARWTRKGSLQAAQQRAKEAFLTGATFTNAGESATTTTNTTPGTTTTSPAGGASEEDGHSAPPTFDLPSVLLSRDARQAMQPLVTLSITNAEDVAQLPLSLFLARYADALLQEERGGGRVVRGGLHRRLRLVARLVSLLSDKDVFLEHHRICLARRLLGSVGTGIRPSSGDVGGSGGGAGATSEHSGACLNLEAERQLVSCLQASLGTSSTHLFESMLRDCEGTQRTRAQFERELAYRGLKAPIRVQLITSAQWPMYALLPLQPHPSLQMGMDAFRCYYARVHPSRALTWVFSLGTATLAAELEGGPKQIVASTLLATLLLTVSDACNSTEGNNHGSAGGVITGEAIARKVDLPFQSLRAHLHLLSHHRAFNLLRWSPGPSNKSAGTAVAAMSEADEFTLNPRYTHKLRKIRLPMPKSRLSELHAGGSALEAAAAGGCDAETLAGGCVESVESLVGRHVLASRRVLLDTALVRVFKSRRVLKFEELFETVVAHLSRQFVPTRRDVKVQLEGLIDRNFVKRTAEDPNSFMFVS